MTGTLRDLGVATRPVAHLGGPDQRLSAEQVEAFVRDQLAAVDVDGRSVCLVIPDGTRSCPFRCCCAPRTVRWWVASRG